MAERKRSKDGERETENFVDPEVGTMQQGRSGGQIARQVGSRDEEKRAEGGSGVTRVRKSDEATHQADGPNATQSKR